MKNKKLMLTIIFFFSIWTFLPSTLFISKDKSVFEITNPDGTLKVAVYHTRVISPYSLYKHLKNQDYYFVLYNNAGKIIFKPSLFYGTSEISAYDSIEFLYHNNGRKELLFPGDDGYEGFDIE